MLWPKTVTFSVPRNTWNTSVYSLILEPLKSRPVHVVRCRASCHFFHGVTAGADPFPALDGNGNLSSSWQPLRAGHGQVRQGPQPLTVRPDFWVLPTTKKGLSNIRNGPAYEIWYLGMTNCATVAPRVHSTLKPGTSNRSSDGQQNTVGVKVSNICNKLHVSDEIAWAIPCLPIVSTNSFMLVTTYYDLSFYCLVNKGFSLVCHGHLQLFA